MPFLYLQMLSLGKEEQVGKDPVYKAQLYLTKQHVAGVGQGPLSAISMQAYLLLIKFKNCLFPSITTYIGEMCSLASS